MAEGDPVDHLGGAHQANPEQVTRQDLYAQVWKAPMLRVAERHGVSSSFLARVCAVMNIPRPARGHWAKLEFGKADPPPPLPEAGVGDKLVWNRGREPDIVAPAPPKPPSVRPPKLRRPVVALPSKRHPLIVGAREHFAKGRVNDAGLLKPAKKLLVDLVVSETSLDAALDTANQLFTQLEHAGHRVMLAPTDRHYRRCAFDVRELPRQGYDHANLWSPWRPTVVYVGTVAIGLTLFETTEVVPVRYVNGKYIPVADLPGERKRHSSASSWTTTKDLASGRVCLQAFSPYALAPWSRQWRETSGKKLTNQAAGIVAELGDAAVEIARLVEEGERQAEIRQLAWEAERRRQAEEAERARQVRVRKESLAELLAVISSWGEMKRMQAFFEEADIEAERLEPGNRELARERIRLARALIGDRQALEALLAWRSPDER